ncbi:SAM domain-containing protein SAMSN-1 isoform X3 [Salmo trutta]|uniref:SAM domain-containing protein SAMSN-1 isoform X3 n=1 Tax=Salmo trutta TaxID=8032 RepID=UPI0011329496|nr:SAM domain-containing protein SAMSN-1-like isoform X3 [Salmo trutta]
MLQRKLSNVSKKDPKSKTKPKVGDVIEIISKPPMGIWTGMLNNKVGNFKFIYVDLIVEKVPEEPQNMRTHRRSRRPRPKTLQELLERLNLEEYAFSLFLNGYQTVDDLKELKEKYLMELNVTDPEHRHLLMAAIESLQEPQTGLEPRSPTSEANVLTIRLRGSTQMLKLQTGIPHHMTISKSNHDESCLLHFHMFLFCNFNVKFIAGFAD